MKIQVRGATTDKWTADNPVLLPGELGYDTETKKARIGDGASTWLNLSDIGTSTDLPFAENVSGAYTIDPANGLVQALTVVGDVTLSLAEPPSGQTTQVRVWLIQDGTGHGVTLPTSSGDPKCLWAMGSTTTPTVSTDANSRNDLLFIGAPTFDWSGYVSGMNMS